MDFSMLILCSKFLATMIGTKCQALIIKFVANCLRLSTQTTNCLLLSANCFSHFHVYCDVFAALYLLWPRTVIDAGSISTNKKLFIVFSLAS